MFEFLKTGGFLVLPILICSIIAMAIIIERLLTLREKNIIPATVIKQAQQLASSGSSPAAIEGIRKSSMVGKVLASGLASAGSPRHIMRESLEESGRHVAHEMEKNLTALGTIAAITPLLGLLGTVIGMIEVFSVITSMGVGSPTDLAGGISTALITTAAGISVAVPALIFHRYFRGKINDFVVRMEQESLKIVELAHAKPKTDKPTPPAPSAASRGLSSAAKAAAKLRG